MTEQNTWRTAKIIGVKESLVYIQVEANSSIMKNELAYIHVGEERLKAEVLRVRRGTADMQVFEDTSGVKVGDKVDLTGKMLSATLGPGLLGQVFDGLLNPLHKLADDYGFFLPRGVTIPALDIEKKWQFTACVKVGDKVLAGGVVGTVPEGEFQHKLMIPFNEPEAVEITWINKDSDFTIDTVIARYNSSKGRDIEMTMQQSWAIRKPIPESMLRRRFAERLYPVEPLTTTTRIVDTFFPIARGGTACIPGPFGAGKTVLQSLIARYSTVDIAIIVACGERAGEVVETITEYPETKDPRTGGTLMDRTIIICNTSSMPVAAREASIYTGITLGEYFRQMGYNVLLIADSTSRWAQAMRETSGRMEEIPGEEAFPAYLDSSIKNVYERAGVLRCPDGSVGSLTMIGTVSPAGGNFEEPVTQSTLGTVKTFLGLSADRAYRRFYPAIDPLMSWTRYFNQLGDWFAKNLDADWVDDVKAMQHLLEQGDSIYQMMQVTGEEGITQEDFVVWQKSLLLDMVYLQQDAFDDIDSCTPRDRQLVSFRLLKKLIDTDYQFKDKDVARDFFTELTNIYKNWNYSAFNSKEFTNYRNELIALACQHSNTEASEF